MYLFLITLIWSVSARDYRIHLYNSDRLSSNELHYQCLHYYSSNSLLFGFDVESADQIIPFCFRPLQPSMGKDDKMGYHKDTLWETFAELREQNITARQLYISSAPIDLVERYQIYLNEPNNLLSEQVFYFCGGTHFGDVCQYMFEYDNSFSDIVTAMFDAKKENKQQIHSMYNNLTCYVHIECYRGPLPMCLDWREVCDGKIDCIDNGIDEFGCDQLESNDCSSTYYRCHNGAQCIPTIMFNDDPLNPDCLDGSDEVFLQDLISHCPSNPTFLCEERMCRHSTQFTCGDGTCNPLPFISFDNKCASTRSELFRATIFSHSSNSHLNYNCWSSMVCLTQIKTDEIDCDEHDCWAGWSKACQELIYRTCPPNFTFPATPAMFGHLYFVYSSNQSHYGRRSGPNYFCYNALLCSGFLPSNIYINGSTCSLYEDLGLKKHSNWNDLIREIQVIFRACSLVENNQRKYQSSNLFCCSNSSKCISKYRLLDGELDCFMGVDEKYTNSCLLEQRHRFKCSNEEKCLSFLMVQDDKIDCTSAEDEWTPEVRNHLDWPPFTMLCDTYQDMHPVLIDGQNETDETNCEAWTCNNMYTRCDGMWNCPNGADEVNCPESFCQPNEHLCISPSTLNLTCIALEQADDGIIDCLGGTDERTYCRQAYSQSPTMRYRCWNDTRCLSTDSLCNKYHVPSDSNQCMHREEQKLCPVGHEDISTQYDSWWGICAKIWDKHRTLSQGLLCNLTNDYESNMYIERVTIFTTFRRINSNSQGNSSVNIISPRTSPITHEPLAQARSMRYKDIWYCNRGILVRLSASRAKRCLCPPSYYGDRCEYQNQRVALTLQFQREIMAERQIVFTFIVMLIDSENQISSHEKITYIPTDNCDIKFNMNLLYAVRPKSTIANYSIRVDAYQAVILQYHASWFISIPFQFLPVNRIAVLLTIPARPTRRCWTSCGRYGQCSYYENSEKLFCKCNEGWSGRFCNIKVKCDCSPDSICIDNVNNRSICVCALGKIGPRCYIQNTVCRIDSCINGGICVPDDERKSEFGYRCVCNERFAGIKCELPVTKITISFADVPIPSFIFAHFITAIPGQPPFRLTKFQKIAYDLQSITLSQFAPFHLLLLEISHIYYLTISHDDYILSGNISARVASSQKCLFIGDLFNITVLKYPLLRRMKYYHLPCQKQKELACFYDEKSMCLCNSDQEANCFKFDRDKLSNCIGINQCYNGAQCFQDHLSCPMSYTCVCPECFYGTLCQFSGRSLGISLDAILGYQIQPNISFTRQPSIVKFVVALTALILSFGYIGSFVSIMTFQVKSSRDIGCGIYLLASSCISPITLTVLGLKTAQLILSQMGIIKNYFSLLVGCRSLDALLNILLTSGGWLHACVAIERALAIIIGVQFDKIRSKKVAKGMIFIVVLVVSLIELPDLIYRQLVYIEDEQRTWCVIIYHPTLKAIDLAITFFHFLAPLLINLISALVIIFLAARTRSNVREGQTFTQHLSENLRQHKHLLISPCLLIILAVPRLFIPSCMQSARDPWLFITSYFLSFIPPILIFPIFVLPSKIYSEAFKGSLKHQRRAIQQRLHLHR